MVAGWPTAAKIWGPTEMARRRKQPIDISETLLRPTPRLERFRRIVRRLEKYREVLVAGGAGRAELLTFDADLDDMRSILRDADTYPPDTPEQEPAGQPVPLCPPGSEQFMAEFFEQLLGDAA